MSAILPHDILAYVGGRALTQYGTATRRTTRLARAGEAQAETVTRADATTCAAYRGSDGLYHLAAPNILRPHYLDLNGDGVFESPSLLLEPAAVANRLLQSRALATTWTATQAVPTNGAVTGVDGVLLSASKLVPDATNSAGHRVTQAVTITANEFLAGSVFLQAGAYSGAVFRISDAGSVNGIQCAIDLLTGNLTLAPQAFGTGTLGGGVVVPWASIGGNIWWQVLLWGAIGNALTSATTFVYAFDTGAHAGNFTAFAGDTVSGINVDVVHLQRNGTTNNVPPSIPIITTTGSISRSGDAFTIPFWGAPSGTFSGYVKFMEMGNANLGVSQPRVVTIGDAVSVTPITYLTYNGGYSGRWNDGVHGVLGSTIGGQPTYGQIVELSWTVNAAGAVQLTESVNGAAPTVGGASAGGLPIPNAFAAPKLFLSSSGLQTAIERCIVTDGFHTMQEFQAVP